MFHSLDLGRLILNKPSLSKWYHPWERTKSKQKRVTSHSNWPHVQLFDVIHKQCNCIIKGRLSCLTSESKGRFLVNNILVFGSARCLVMAEIQFSLNKNKDWTPRTLATPHPLHPITSHFCLTPSPPQRGHHMCIIL